MEDAENRRKLACDSCRKKKIKCEWDDDKVCNRCVQRRLPCIPHPTQPKRKERKPNTYLSSLEDRLRRMEEAIKKPSSSPSPSRRMSGELRHQSIPDQMSALKINDDGTSIFVGSASTFSIISPLGMKWIADITGNDDFERVVARIPNLSEIGASDPKVWSHLKDEDREPLPSIRRAIAHFDFFFCEGFNTIFPLFDEKQVRERFARQYPVTPSQDIAWYASLNMIFSISAIVHGKIESPAPLKESSPSSNKLPRSSEFQQSSCWKWFRNAASTFNDLQFLDGSLPAVQAMIAMCFILQTLPNPFPSLVVSASAMRLAQAIGLHRHLPHLNLSPAEIEHRRNIFWVGLVVERQITVRMGRPSVIHDDDIGVDLPKEIGLPGLTYGHLRYMSQIVLIQGKIYNSLYTARSLTKPRLERLRLAGLLDEEVQYWRDQLPLSVRPGCEIEPAGETFFPPVMMHFAYFNSLTMIHRVSSHHGPWTEKNDESPIKALRDSDINPRVLSGGSICVEAARGAINLLKNWASAINLIDLNMIRVISYYPLSASLTLFANVLQQPLHPQALDDVELMKSVTSILLDYLDDADAPTIFIIEFFNEVNRLAGDFVHKSQNQSRQGVKREDEIKAPWTSEGPIAFKADSTGESPTSNSQQRFSDDNQTDFTSSHASPTGMDDSSYVSPYTSAPGSFQAQPSTSNQQLFDSPSSDPFHLLDHSQGYNNPLNMDFDPAWTSGNDVVMQPELFIPHDGSWFFPIANPLNPWEVPNQPTDFTNMQNDSTMQ